MVIGLLTLAALAAFFIAGRVNNTEAQMALAQVPNSKWSRVLYSHKLKNVEETKWAGHPFERAVLYNSEWKTIGNKDVKFTSSGFHAPSYAMPRSRLLDVNFNEKVKVRISGIFEGELTNPDWKNCSKWGCRYFSEFAIYMRDESGNSKGMRLLGTRENIVRGNTRNKFKFTELVVENTGSEIVVSDSSGFSLAYSLDFKYVTAQGHKEPFRGTDYGELNPKQKWFLQINCHQNGEGYCRLDIKDIQVIK